MNVILGREESGWALTLEEVVGSRDWGSGLHGLELGQHGEAVDNPIMGPLEATNAGRAALLDCSLSLLQSQVHMSPRGCFMSTSL